MGLSYSLWLRGHTVRFGRFGLYVGESIANAGMRDSFGIV